MMLRSPSRALVASQLQIRPFEPADWRAVWALLEPVFRAGETFPHDPAISEAEARVAWVEQSQAVMVAVDAAGALVGTYYLRPNSLPSAPMWPMRATWWPSTAGARESAAGCASTPCRRRGGWGSERCSSTWW
jgi:hypothetical protein